MKKIIYVFLFISFLVPVTSMAQKTITGTVSDDSGIPLPGASVIVKNTIIGTATDIDGKFNLSVPENGTDLIIQYIGFVLQEIQIGDKSVINVQLVPNATMLAEVEIVADGYITLPKTRVTGAFSSVKSADLDQIMSTSLLEKLDGQLAGLDIRDGQIFIRGQNSFNTGDEELDLENDFDVENKTGEARGVKLADGSQINYRTNPSAPLIVLDGFPYNGSIDDIDPLDVESVTILKDAASASIWGTRASNGVIVITRKKAVKDQTSIRFDAFFEASDQPSIEDYNLASADLAFDIERYALDSLGYAKSRLTNLGGATSAIESVLYQRDVIKTITYPEAERMLQNIKRQSNYKQGQDAFLRKSFTQNYNLQLAHQQGKLSNILSFNYADDKFTQVGNDNNQINISLRSGYQFTDWLDVKFNYTVSNKAMNNNSMANFFTSGRIRPYENITDDNGNYLPMYYRGGSSYGNRMIYEPKGYLPWQWNVLEEQNNNDNSTKSRNDIVQFNVNVKLPFGFIYHSQVQYQTGNSNRELYYGMNSFATRDIINKFTTAEEYYTDDDGEKHYALTHNVPNGGGIRQTSSSVSKMYNFRHQLNFDRTFAELHRLSAHFGTDLSVSDVDYRTNTVYGYNPVSGEHGTKFMNFRDMTIDMASQSNNLTFNGEPTGLGLFMNSDGFNKMRDFALFGNLGYTIDNRYNLTFSGRSDRSNLTAGVEGRNNLWSVGAGWTVTNEKFMESLMAINYFKLRGSYGYTGNVDRSATPFLRGEPSRVSSSDINGYYVSEGSNPNLKMEKKKNMNIGIDLKMFNNRIGLTADYYDNVIKHLIVSQPTDPTRKGFNSGRVNDGSISNKGLDIKLDADIVSTNSFSWKSTLNVGFNNSKTLNYTIKDTPNFRKNLISGARKIEGYDVDPIFSYQYVGLDETGAPNIKLNGETVTPFLLDEVANTYLTGYERATIEDLVYSGGKSPKFYGGLFNTFRYKSFSLMMNFNYKFGHYMRMPVVDVFAENVFQSTPSKFIENVWQNPGDENHTDIPRLTTTKNTDQVYSHLNQSNNHRDWYRYGSHNVEKADVIRLRYINLSYQLPRHIVNKVALKSVRLSAQVNNIWHWAANSEGYDPDYVNRPNPRTYTIGIYTTF